MSKKIPQKFSKSNEVPNISVFQAKVKKISQLESSGGLDQAMIEAQNLTKQFPNNHITWNILGNICRKCNATTEAEQAFRQATRVNSNSYESFLNLGLILQSQKHFTEAISALERANTLYPSHPQLVFALANLCRDAGDLEKSVKYYKDTIPLNPKFLLQVYFNFSQLLYNNKKYSEAVPIYKKIVRIQPDNAQAYNNLGNCFQNLDKLPDAVSAYEAAIKAKPDYSEAFTHLGLALRSLGEKEKAISAFEAAIQHKEENSNAYLYLSELKTFDETDPHIKKMANLLEKDETKPSDKSNLLFALGKVHEDCNQYEEAFLSYREANKIKKSILKISIERDEYIFKRVKEVSPNISQQSIRNTPQVNDLSPIFILGMPRSGTTLVEQIISCHSKVQAAGELTYINKFGSSLTLSNKEITRYGMEIFQKNYLKSLEAHSNGKAFVTDKFPHNFLHIGLIINTLPNAKIIHVKRDASATCWSNFKNHFIFEGSAYNFDLDDTVTYYNLYNDLMNFWNNSFPNQIYTINYDTLTEQPEAETKRLINNLELKWEDECLAPQKNTRHIRTASHGQVRKKIYKGSSNDWKKFEQHLNVAFSRLPDA